MKTAAASLVFVSACALATAAASIDPASKNPAPNPPIPAHELNFSPAFSGYSTELTLIGAKPAPVAGTVSFRPANLPAVTAAKPPHGQLVLRAHGGAHAPAFPAVRPSALPKFDASLPAMPPLELKLQKRESK
jgi:hypothetical protein